MLTTFDHHYQVAIKGRCPHTITVYRDQRYTYPEALPQSSGAIGESQLKWRYLNCPVKVMAAVGA